MGRNTWIKQPREEDGDLVQPGSIEPGVDDGNQEPRRINIGGKATVLMGKGDRLLIETPGGGAWGAIKQCEEDKDGAGVISKAKDMIEWAARGSLAERAAVQAGF